MSRLYRIASLSPFVPAQAGTQESNAPISRRAGSPLARGRTERLGSFKRDTLQNLHRDILGLIARAGNRRHFSSSGRSQVLPRTSSIFFLSICGITVLRKACSI